MNEHPCPRCGRPTSGTYSGGGLKWAICGECMDLEAEESERELREQEEREAIRAVNKGEWFNDDLSI